MYTTDLTWTGSQEQAPRLCRTCLRTVLTVLSTGSVMKKSSDFLGQQTYTHAKPASTQNMKKSESESLASTHAEKQLDKEVESDMDVKAVKTPKAPEEAPQQPLVHSSENGKLGILFFAIFCFLRASTYLCTDLLY